MPLIRLSPLAAGLIATSAWAAVAFLGDARAHPVAFVAAYAVAFAAYAAMVAAVLRGRGPGLLAVVAFALLFRALALPVQPSDDMNRYLWEGRVQLAGHDPYRQPPDDPALSTLAADDPWHGGVNHPAWTAIYPPLTMVWHRGVAAVAYTPLAMKLSFLLAEAVAAVLVIALLRRRGLAANRVLIFLWNPLAVATVAMEGHHESLAAVGLLGALLLAERTTRPGAAGARAGLMAGGALAAAVLAKGFAAACAPALLKRRPLALVTGAVVVGGALLWPFAGTGTGLATSLGAFGGELHHNDALHGLAAAFLGPTASRLTMAAVWLALALWVVRRGPDDPLHRAAILLGGLLLVLPTIHPWYLFGLLPLLSLFPWWGWIAVSGTMALTWLPELEIAATGEWAAWPWLRVPIYAPLFLWLAVTAIRRFDRPRLAVQEPRVSEPYMQGSRS